MRKWLSLIMLFFSVNIYGQAPCNFSADNSIEVFKKTGDSTTISWVMPDPLPTDVAYIRIRRATLISGTFAVWKTFPANTTTYAFNYDLTSSQYYFITIWRNELQPDGTTAIKEGIGSNMIRIRIKP